MPLHHPPLPYSRLNASLHDEIQHRIRASTENTLTDSPTISFYTRLRRSLDLCARIPRSFQEDSTPHVATTAGDWKNFRCGPNRRRASGDGAHSVPATPERNPTRPAPGGPRAFAPGILVEMPVSNWPILSTSAPTIRKLATHYPPFPQPAMRTPRRAPDKGFLRMQRAQPVVRGCIR